MILLVTLVTSSAVSATYDLGVPPSNSAEKPITRFTKLVKNLPCHNFKLAFLLSYK